MAAESRNPMRCDLSYPERALQAARNRKLNARLENGATEIYTRKHKLRTREVYASGSHDPTAFKFLLEGLPLEERLHSSVRERAHPGRRFPLPLIRRATIFCLHPLAI